MNVVEFKMQPRPKAGGSMCVVPDDAAVIAVLGGGARHGGVRVTAQQLRGLERLYGFDLKGHAALSVKASQDAYEKELAFYEEKKRTLRGFERERLRPPEPPDAAGVAYMQTGGDTLQLFRHAEPDGMRMVALIAAYLDPGEDPVRRLAKMLMDQGYDVPVDPEWADTDWPHDGPERAAEPRSDG